MSQAFDLIVIGGGPGGYVAAYRAVQLGLRTAIIEKTPSLGGTCLHRGCIPTKVLLQGAEMMESISTMKSYGITVKEVSVDWKKLMARKRAVVTKYVKGLEFLAKRGKIEVIEGLGSIPAPGRVTVTPEKGPARELTGKGIIIATGSQVSSIPGLEIDGKKIISSDDALELTALPKSIVVLGGGAVGVEFASLYNSFGVKTTVVEMLPALLPMMEPDVSKELERAFKKRGIQVRSGTRFSSVKPRGKTLDITLESKGGDSETINAEILLVAVGRKPVLDGLGLDKIGVQMDGRFIKAGPYQETSVPGIYAIGDVLKTLALAHLASEEGVIAVEHIAGHETEPINHGLVPSNIYTLPEVASVGLTEAEAREKGHDVKTGKFPFSANSKSAVIGHTEGFVKIVTDKKYGEILGIHMIGPHVTELLAGPTGVMASEGTVYELAKTIHPHPTLSEAVHEAALAAIDGAIHA